MPLAFVPILAQTLAVGVGDRTELRYRIDEAGDTWEAETRPAAQLTLGWPNSSLTLAYSPTITVSPLETDDREYTVFQQASANASFQLRWRRTIVVFNEGVEYHRQNFRVQALRSPGVQPGPAPPADPTMDPAPAQLPDQIRLYTSRQTTQTGRARSEVILSHQASRKGTVGAFVGYDITGGLDESSRLVSPVQYGPDAGLSYAYALSRRDTLTTTAEGELVMTLAGQRVYLATLEQGIAHRFSRKATGQLSAGLAYAREEPLDEPASQGFYPTGSASFEYTTRLERGTFQLSLGATSAPVVDRATAFVDPRIGFNASVIWIRRRLTLYATSSSGVSLDQESEVGLNSISSRLGAIYRATRRLSLYTYAEGTFAVRPDATERLESVAAGAGAGYDLGAGFFFDAGVRGALEEFEGEQIVPGTVGAYVGLSWYALLQD